MTSIEKRAYDLFSATFREKAKKKLLSSKRGFWSGKMMDSLNVEVVENGDDITLNIYAESYMEYIDEGVNGTEVNNGSPYSYKKKKPPIEFIKPWAESKGLNPYAVQQSIYKKGIKGIHFFESTLNEEFDKMLDYIAEAKVNSLLNDFGDD